MPVVTYWPGKVHDVVEIGGDPRALILNGLSPVGVKCHVSVHAGMVVAVSYTHLTLPTICSV